MRTTAGAGGRWARQLAAALAAVVLGAAAASAAQRPPAAPTSGRVGDGPRVGFTVHWDFFASAAEADRLVAFAIANGAEILNVVPPPHIWEQPESLAELRKIFATARRHGVAVVLSRIDGSSFPDAAGERRNWLYTNVLTERGRLPSGKETPDFFLATVGKPAYERWLAEETAFYAKNFSSEPALVGFSVGLFNEPFVSQRGSLLCFDPDTDSYEIGQYTPYAAAVWRRFLMGKYRGIGGVNRRYGTHFPALTAVPMPVNERDPAFAHPDVAYYDFVSAINGWVVRQLDRCRSIWHARARRSLPFMLQFSGYVPEKFEKGRPAFAALDIFDWMTRTDALGLSAYTNCEYPDLGHASVTAMVNFLRLGALLREPVYVLEGGSECDGAVLDPGELRFFATVAAPLGPASLIYEFLKVSYAEAFATSAGKLLGADWKPRPDAVAAVRAALAEGKAARGNGSTTYVLDDLAGLPDDTGLLAIRALLARLAMTRPLTFVPPAALAGLPAGSTLVVPSQRQRAALGPALAGRGIAVVGAERLLGAQSAGH
ncbi:MAG TPA: hypothetical protein PK435_04430 [Thermoanaerobaculaceae bacterium]|nr:hypothetical protein [Thermoanaerobaculaceae bacterium]